jgi:hypothetical protein
MMEIGKNLSEKQFDPAMPLLEISPKGADTESGKRIMYNDTHL